MVGKHNCAAMQNKYVVIQSEIHLISKIKCYPVVPKSSFRARNN